MDRSMSATQIYLDYAATAPVLEPVQRTMRAVEAAAFGNPSSRHWAGTRAAEVLEGARRAILGRARLDGRLVFTSGASESNLIGLVGAAMAGGHRRILTSAVEHESVHAACRMARNLGIETDQVPVDGEAHVRLDELARCLERGPAAVAIMHANNEVGTLQDVAPIAELVRAGEGTLHVDAAQSFGKVSLEELAGADTVALSAHKLGGPRGIGGLIIAPGGEVVSPLGGGSQEFGLRHGTENIPGIAGFATAAAHTDPEKDGTQLAACADRLRENLAEAVPEIRWTGDLQRRAPHIISCVIPGVPGELLVASLDHLGIAASVGSACHANGLSYSPILSAMGAERAESLCALRLSVGHATTIDEIDYAAAMIAEAVHRLREIVLAGWDSEAQSGEERHLAEVAG